MIKAVTLRNIRVFGEPEAVFRLPKLTVFTGTNSSGKSTVLKTLLLLRQTLGISESTGVTADTLRFVGSQVDLGTYDSFVFCRQVQREILIGIEVEDRIRRSDVELLRPSLGLSDSKTSQIKKPKSKVTLPYILKVSMTFGSNRFLGDLQDQISKGSAEEDEKALPALEKAHHKGS